MTTPRSRTIPTGPVLRRALTATAFLLCVSRVGAQANMAPVNTGPNPYRTVEGWAKLPAGRTWGATSAVDVDRDGTSIWVAERCGANSCGGSTLPALLKFDAGGNLVGSYAQGLFISPHGIDVDHEGNVWVTDCACTGRGPAAGGAAGPPKGHQVFKFAPDGRLLMTLG